MTIHIRCLEIALFDCTVGGSLVFIFLYLSAVQLFIFELEKACVWVILCVFFFKLC